MIEAEAPRIRCGEHGVVVAAVPWARHHAGHTRFFDDQVAWLTVQCSKTAVTQLMRIAWRTVGAIVARVCADIDASVDRLANLRRIGIDEVSYKRGHRYLTVIVDHDTRRLVWVAPGHGKKVLEAFFDTLGDERAGQITHVSADAADWIADVVTDRAPNAVRCADAFHIVAWATDALAQVRRDAWNEARRAVTRRVAGRASGQARALKRARYALWKNPDNLTDKRHRRQGVGCDRSVRLTAWRRSPACRYAMSGGCRVRRDRTRLWTATRSLPPARTRWLSSPSASPTTRSSPRWEKLSAPWTCRSSSSLAYAAHARHPGRQLG